MPWKVLAAWRVVVDHVPKDLVNLCNQLRAEECSVFTYHILILKVFGVSPEYAFLGKFHVIFASHGLLKEVLKLHAELLVSGSIQVAVSYFPIELVSPNVLPYFRPFVHGNAESPRGFDDVNLILHAIEF